MTAVLYSNQGREFVEVVTPGNQKRHYEFREPHVMNRVNAVARERWKESPVQNPRALQWAEKMVQNECSTIRKIAESVGFRPTKSGVELLDEYATWKAKDKNVDKENLTRCRQQNSFSIR